MSVTLWAYKKDQEGHVIPIPGRLIYRGVDINEIVNEAYRNDRFVFEEVIWLLLFGSCPPRSSWTISVSCWQSTAPCPMVLWIP